MDLYFYTTALICIYCDSLDKYLSNPIIVITLCEISYFMWKTYWINNSSLIKNMPKINSLWCEIFVVNNLMDINYKMLENQKIWVLFRMKIFMKS